MDILTIELMQRMWPRGDQHVPGLLEGIVATAPAVFDAYKVTTSTVVVQAFAQFSEECGAGLEMVENDNFTADQLSRLWPSHFTGSMAERYAHNPRMICDVAYGGRMGNAPPPSDDGYNRRGRGMSQVTGEDGYLALQKELTRLGLGIDIMANPDLVSDPRYALWCGFADFVLCGCLPYAERDDVVSVSSMLNVGHIAPPEAINGLAVRKAWLSRWKAAIASPARPAAAPALKPAPLPPAPAAAPAPAPAPAPATLEEEIRALIAGLQRIVDRK